MKGMYYLDGANKKLTAIGIGASICHANNARSNMSHCGTREIITS